MPGADVDIARPDARSIYRDAFQLFREHFGLIVGTAAVVLVPFAVLEGIGIMEIHVDGDASLPVAAGGITYGVIAATISGLASIFYAGLLDYASAAWHRGVSAPEPRAVFRELPWFQLVLASTLVYVISLIGVLLGIIPGIVALTLFVLTGPLLVRENLTAGGAMRRGAGLVRRRPLLVFVTAALPLVLELELADVVALLIGHHLLVELTVEVLAALFLASFVGLLEVVTAHQLLATEATITDGVGPTAP